MKQIALITIVLTSFYGFISFKDSKDLVKTYSLTIKVHGLRNTKGHVQFSLYNKNGSIPDENYENYYQQKNGIIINHSSTVTFHHLPIGNYAINILHDENKNGIIEKGWIFPIEGIGFSNFDDIGFSNRPSFKKASFQLDKHTVKTIKVIYM
jgi:uncharacterized protein (DUF2141 family)